MRRQSATRLHGCTPSTFDMWRSCLSSRRRPKRRCWRSSAPLKTDFRRTHHAVSHQTQGLTAFLCSGGGFVIVLSIENLRKPVSWSQNQRWMSGAVAGANPPGVGRAPGGCPAAPGTEISKTACNCKPWRYMEEDRWPRGGSNVSERYLCRKTAETLEISPATNMLDEGLAKQQSTEEEVNVEFHQHWTVC